MLHRCGGVCRGDESPQDHRSRLLASLEGLRLVWWPYPGAMGLVERDGKERQIHVIRNWCYLGSVRTKAEARQLAVKAARFDSDAYKILCQVVVSGSVEMIAL